MPVMDCSRLKSLGLVTKGQREGGSDGRGEGGNVVRQRG